MPAKYIDTLRRNAKQVQQLEGQKAEEFLRLLKQLEIELGGRMASAYASDKALKADMLGRILRETKAGISVLEDKASGLYNGLSEDAIQLSVDHTIDEITRLSVGLDDVGIDISIDAAAGLADPAQLLLANHFETSVQRYGLDILNGVRRRLFTGLRAGDSYGSVVRDVAKITQVSKAQATQLVRTETSAAYGAAQHNSIAQAAKQVPGGLKKVWIHQSSYVCETCIDLHDTERPLNGTWTFKIGKKLKTVAHPPAHPNCTCRIAAMKPKWRSALQKLGYLDSPKPSKDE